MTYLLLCADNIARLGCAVRAKRAAEKIRGSPSEGVRNVRYNQYFKEFIALTVSVDKALAYFATHPDMVLGLCGRDCEESGLELKQAT